MAETKVSSTQPAKKKRSPIERAIVWGLIGVLLVVVLWEAWARFSYERTLTRLQDAIAAAESGEADGSLKLAEAEKLISGIPSRSTPEQQGLHKTIVLNWNSLFKRDYSISVSYAGDPPDVLGIETANAPEEKVAAPAPTDEELDEYAEMAGPPGGGGGGPPGMHVEGRPRGGRPADDAPVKAPPDADTEENAASSDGPSLGRDPKSEDDPESSPEPE